MASASARAASSQPHDLRELCAEACRATPRLNKLDLREARLADRSQSSLRKNAGSQAPPVGLRLGRSLRRRRAADLRRSACDACSERKALEIRKQEALRKARAAERKERSRSARPLRRTRRRGLFAEEEIVGVTGAKVAQMKALAEVPRGKMQAAQAKKR